MFQYLFFATWVVVLVALCIAAALRGGWAERSAASLTAIGWIGSLVIVQWTQAWAGPHVGLFVIDLFYLLAMLWVAMRSAKLWALMACGFQLCGVGLHLAYFAEPHVWSGAYFVGLQITSSALLGAIGFGVVTSWQQKRRE